MYNTQMSSGGDFSKAAKKVLAEIDKYHKLNDPCTQSSLKKGDY